MAFLASPLSGELWDVVDRTGWSWESKDQSVYITYCEESICEGKEMAEKGKGEEKWK